MTGTSRQLSCTIHLKRSFVLQNEERVKRVSSTISASSVTALDRLHVSLPDSIRLKREEEAGCERRREGPKVNVLTS